MARHTAEKPPVTDEVFVGMLALGAIAAVGVLAETAWLAGQLATFAAHGHWPRSPAAGQSLRVLLGIFVHRGSIHTYWPAAPTWLFYAIVALIAAACGAAAFKAATWLARHSNKPGARWGGAAVERKLTAAEDPAKRVGRIIAGFGEATRILVGAARNLSAIAFGIPGSGKTAAIVIPMAIDWVGPCLMTTVKGADVDPIRAAKPENFFILAPAGLADGYPCHYWSPVDYCTDAKAADRMATWFAEAASIADDERATVWVDQAIPILKGMLYAAALEGGGIEQFRRWLQQGQFASEEVYGVLMKHARAAADSADRIEKEQAAFDYLNPWKSLHADGIGSIQLTLNVVAKVYADEEVRHISSRTTVDARRLLDTGGTLCLVAPEGDTQRYAPLFTAIIASIIHEAESRYKATGRPLNPPLGLFVDEAGNFLKYKKLPNLLTTGRGVGIVALTIWHDLSQLRATYGENNAGTIINASPLRMLLPGNADLPTLQLFNQLLGKALVSRRSVSQGGGYTRAQHQLSLQETELGPLHELAQLEDDTALALYSNMRPIRVRLRAWYKDKRLLALIPTRRVHVDGKTIIEVIQPREAANAGEAE